MEGENMAAGCDLGADGWAVQGDGAAQWCRCQHLHLHTQLKASEKGGEGMDAGCDLGADGWAVQRNIAA